MVYIIVSAILGIPYYYYLICKGYYWYCQGLILKEKALTKRLARLDKAKNK